MLGLVFLAVLAVTTATAWAAPTGDTTTTPPTSSPTSTAQPIGPGADGTTPNTTQPAVVPGPSAPAPILDPEGSDDDFDKTELPAFLVWGIVLSVGVALAVGFFFLRSGRRQRSS
jgi:hypothetical protein